MAQADGTVRRLLIYGAGGHGRVVLDAALQSGSYNVCGLLDDDPEMHGRQFHGVAVLGGIGILEDQAFVGCQLIIGVGCTRRRRALAEVAGKRGVEFASVIHPSVVIGSGARIGEGSVALPMSVIHTDAILGAHVIINTGATVDHDAKIGDFAHIAPGAHIGGGVCVGRETLIGIGASVIPSVSIGANAIIAAGAAVIEDVPDGAVVAGVPARPRGDTRDDERT